mmetsp:Transcript_19018/g.41202  ORF Transcript_19018/g.41202 Transcript_19018/m.41202 type:complete len:355 (+) Transcript_19018:2-1066(+)
MINIIVSVWRVSDWTAGVFSNEDMLSLPQEIVDQLQALIIQTNEDAKVAVTVDKSSNANSKPNDDEQEDREDAGAITEDVSCGNHRSDSCAKCPQGKGGGWCHGDCQWIESTKQCNDIVTFSSFKVISEDEVTYLHELLSIVTDAFATNKVTYWLMNGTLIGAMRNRPAGIMRWDDDLDIGVPHDEFPRALEILSSDSRIECKKWDDIYWDGQKCGLKSHNPKIHGQKYNLDIWEWHYVKSQKGEGPHWYIYSSVRGKADWFTERYLYASEVNERVPCQFWDLTLQCPQDSKAYLQCCFGSKVMEIAKVYSHHAQKGPSSITLEKDNMNDHEAYTPGLNQELMTKLIPNPNDGA